MRITSTFYNSFRDAMPLNRNLTKNIVLVMILISSLLLIINFLSDRYEERRPLFDAFYECAYPKYAAHRGDYDQFWASFVNSTLACEDLPAYRRLDIRPVSNKDEIKYVALPNKKDHTLTMVTFGVGHDVTAEIEMKQVWRNTNFYGVDPSSDVNKALYEGNLGGKFFEYAISGHSGKQKSYILTKEYRNETIMHIRADTFFGDILRKPIVDLLWMDTEGYEFPVLEMIHKEGPLDDQGIKLCQINVEIHKDIENGITGERKMFHDFVWRLMEDKRYIMIRPFNVFWYHDFIRIVLINVADKECTDLYVR
ncbi:Methyltransferase FkbM domain-containing protein [Caenorhabditis elegans]|uniref:Methyltransferase FkbM domain-containing protein n=1 Tax=Caenorhabditis elegans TaxID=6239 RepID=Q18417_CAEEL|nr:Methyltransferase FkbM domain-containing protein [Caenorhabditis elegans]CCD66585.1 Methyltransferase FkbM domain-containing protein [Caenorhabditis elegans]|eukprot:NP_501295.3 Uncharacterized protein CELE_C33H5.1 [Caenorhabditis elegans]